MAETGGSEKREQLINEYKISVMKDEHVLEICATLCL